MQPRTSIGDGFRVSVSSLPSNASGGSEPDDIESLGDVYIWGEVSAEGVVASDGNGIQAPSKIDVLIPKPLESNVVLDANQIACGVHHIAIVTRQGEVFTWGEESGGRLGHGIDRDFCSPQLVEFPAATNLDFVACGEYHTCAISKSEDIFTWGDGAHNVGLLGHGTEASHWIPKRVDGPLVGLQVVSVACGTWHSALATSNGKLFTFGDGTFGVLGHGDQESVMYPKEVQMLSGLRTIKVACGVWHTAAIIEVSFQSGSNVTSWKLFTWGDGDKYRLGHGNKETYLQPTRVSSLIEYNFHQISCGHTMTVALTTSGHVFTMGGTENGQLGNPLSTGKAPTLVQDKLLGEFVEEISCGAQHVAVLTSKSELYTWGKGTNGRLGHGDIEDKKSPTLVAALKDRHVKHISCGSNFTSCICIHKWVVGTDQSGCSGCRQGFGLTRKRHNCYNCGLVYCHACSSRKVLKASLAPTPDKPHRVCDACYAKLKAIEAGTASSMFHRKANPSQGSIGGKEILSTLKATPSHSSIDGVVKSSRILLSPAIEPIKYLEIRNSKSGSKYDSTSFVRASQVPSLLQLKDVAFPSSLSVIQNALKTASPQQNLHENSTLLAPCPRKPSPPRSSSPRVSNRIDNLRKTSELLKEEVSKLQNQVRSLNKKNDMQDMEILKLQRNATEATAFSAVEFSNLMITKEFIESTIDKVKEMTEKLPPEIPESTILRTIHTKAEDFLKETLESETCSKPSKLESEQQNEPDTHSSPIVPSKLQEQTQEENVDAARVDPSQANASMMELEEQKQHDIAALDNVSSKQQNHMVEENVDTARVDPSQAEEHVLQESNASMKELEEQKTHDIVASDNDSSEQQNHIGEENVDTARVDSSQAEDNELQESNASMMELEEQKQHDIVDSDNVSSNQQNHIVKENVDAAKVDPSQAEELVLQESYASMMELEEQKTHDIQNHIVKENVDAARVDSSQAEENVLKESNGSFVSSIEEEVIPQTSENVDTTRYRRRSDSTNLGKC
ncbi:putative chromatin regulator PHD family [Lupinus albus]|uniref:Putative chromatin regulator PHD family n=1 Tax=Lupinus albus TaxID=3870 RepID=A0A6A4PH36_LUPAL|nr:putative chromatin regulator PHD family [Lupinus albus]